jgi:hypothetical protein
MDDRSWVLVLGLALGIAFSFGAIFWYREHWSSAEWARGSQQSSAHLSRWGDRVGRSAYRGMASALGLWMFAIIAVCGGVLLLQLSADGAPLHAIGGFLTWAGAAAFAVGAVLWLSAFFFGRPNFLLPPGLRNQPGYIWDRGPIKHSAWVATTQPAGEARYYAAFCDCGWMDVPHDSEASARAAATAHTPNVRTTVKELPS